MRERILLNADEHQLDSLAAAKRMKQQSLQQAQELIYQFLIITVKQDSPERVLLAFKRLFLFCDSPDNLNVLHSLYTIIFNNNENEFINTLKRSSYILINNWSSKRQYDYIQNLIQLLSETATAQRTLSPSVNRLRSWIANFINSEDYQELKLFASPYTAQDRSHWSSRYRFYLLVPQYLNPQNPIEQREIARSLSKRLKDKFKFELAMYTAHCNSPNFKEGLISNPTSLGSGVIRLIKKVVSKPLLFNHINHANIFVQQTKNANYREFKQSLQKYLFFYISQNYLEALNTKFSKKLGNLYANHDRETLSGDLFLRTCRQTVSFFTTEDGQEPSFLFILLITHENPLTIAVILLKIVLICQYIQTHLEVCIAQLIRYYENCSEKECQWFINFLEIFNIVFAIYTANVQYNLVKVKGNAPDSQRVVELDTYRIFSQFKGTDLRGVDLRGVDLSQADLNAADLREANLSGANLSQADLSLAKLSKANLSNAILDGANLIAADLHSADLRGASLSGAKLRRADLRCAKLSSAGLTAAKLYLTNLQDAALSSANLRYAELQPVDLSDANLRGADLRHSQLLHANLRGANLYQANLSNANLMGANLTQANLNSTDLNHANLQDADLNFALLRRAMLSDASLSSANLSYADLSHAQLSNVDLSGSDLSYALIRHANLSETNLSCANLNGANLFNTNLNLATVKGAQFRQNSGLSKQTKLKLEQQKAILVDRA